MAQMESRHLTDDDRNNWGIITTGCSQSPINPALADPSVRQEKKEMDADEKRIHGILGDDNARTMHNAARYREYLLKHLSLPIIVTGTEDFPWEEPYVFGGWDKREYEKLKKTNPSYTDTFELQSLEPPNEHEDIVAKAKRVSDGKVFEIGLSWLCCEDEDSEAYTLLDDYGIWHTNY